MKAKKSLVELKKIVNDTPSTLKDNTIALIIPLLISMMAIEELNSITKTIVYVTNREKSKHITNHLDDTLKDKHKKYKEDFDKILHSGHSSKFSYIEINNLTDKYEKEEKKIINEINKIYEETNKKTNSINKTVNKVGTGIESGVLIAGVASVKKVNLFKSLVLKKINFELMRLQKIELMMK